MLEDFRTYDLVAGLPTLSVTKNGVSFNKSAISKLGYPERIHLMINDNRGQVAIQNSKDENLNSIPFFKENKRKAITARWNYKDFTYMLAKMANRDIDKGGFRVVGEYIHEENALVFDMKNAENSEEIE